jgi:hypothetical protein
VPDLKPHAAEKKKRARAAAAATSKTEMNTHRIEKRLTNFNGHPCLISYFKNLPAFERALIDGTPSADVTYRLYDANGEWMTLLDTLEFGDAHALRAETFAHVDRITTRFIEDHTRDAPSAQLLEMRREHDQQHVQAMRTLYKSLSKHVRRLIRIYNKSLRRRGRKKHRNVAFKRMNAAERALFLCDKRDTHEWKRLKYEFEKGERERAFREELQPPLTPAGAPPPDARTVRMKQAHARATQRAARTAAKKAPKRKRGESDDVAETIVSSTDLFTTLCAVDVGGGDDDDDAAAAAAVVPEALLKVMDAKVLGTLRAAAMVRHKKQSARYSLFVNGDGASGGSLSAVDNQTLVDIGERLERATFAEVHMALLKKNVRKHLRSEDDDADADLLERLKLRWSAQTLEVHKYTERLRTRARSLIARKNLALDLPRKYAKTEPVVDAAAAAAAATAPTLPLPAYAKRFIETGHGEETEVEAEVALSAQLADYLNPITLFGINTLVPHVMGRRWLDGEALVTTMEHLTVFDPRTNKWHLAKDFDDDELAAMTWKCARESLPPRAARDRTLPVPALANNTKVYYTNFGAGPGGADDDDDD